MGSEVGVLTSVEVVPHGEEGHVEGHIPHGRVGLEDGDDGNLDEHEEDRVFPREGGAGQTERGRSVRDQATPETPDPPLDSNPKVLSGVFTEGWLCYPQDTGPGQVAEAENCGDRKMPRGGEESPANTEKQSTETLPINPSPTALSLPPGAVEEENK